jgi:hypothetical protein
MLGSSAALDAVAPVLEPVFAGEVIFPEMDAACPVGTDPPIREAVALPPIIDSPTSAVAVWETETLLSTLATPPTFPEEPISLILDVVLSKFVGAMPI